MARMRWIMMAGLITSAIGGWGIWQFVGGTANAEQPPSGVLKNVSPARLPAQGQAGALPPRRDPKVRPAAGAQAAEPRRLGEDSPARSLNNAGLNVASPNSGINGDGLKHESLFPPGSAAHAPVNSTRQDNANRHVSNETSTPATGGGYQGLDAATAQAPSIQSGLQPANIAAPKSAAGAPPLADPFAVRVREPTAANGIARPFDQNPAANAASPAPPRLLNELNTVPASSQRGNGNASNSDSNADNSNGGGNSSANSPVGSASNALANTAISAIARPGQKQLDGPQTPQLTIEKQAPAEVQVGRPAAFVIKVRNTGNVAAHDVTVLDAIPEGCQFVKSQPPVRPGTHGELLWSLGALNPGEESAITLEILPQSEGELGSVATVQFRSLAGGRTLAVKPSLQLHVNGPKEIMIGDDVTLQIKISNPGSGAASNVVLEEHVPASLKHAGGSELELDIGALKPGETKELDLTLNSLHAGRVVNALTARGDGGLRAETAWEFEILAPALQITFSGPAKRFLERQATYVVTVANPGTAAAKDVELVTHLPRGMKFIKADNEGTYDAVNHCVIWSLDELPAKEQGAVTVTALPIEQGEHKLKTTGKARQGLADEKEQTVLVEGVSAIFFEVADLADPIELHGETSYDVRIINQGSKEATNVQLIVVLPPELKFTAAEGATRYRNEGGRIVFEPLDRLPAKSETIYRIKALGERSGDVRVKAQLTTDDIRQPITKEESTRVYADE